MRYIHSVATVINGSYEWESEKAESNIANHGVSFEEAITSLEAVVTYEIPDEYDARRIKTTGFSLRGNLLLVVTTEYDVPADRTRIISARRATPQERKDYTDNTQW